MGEHQYIDVKYFSSLGTAGLFPNVAIQGTLVLRDGQTVKDESVVERVVRLGVILLSDSVGSVIDEMEPLADFYRQGSQAKLNAHREVDWFRDQETVITRYASQETLRAFVSTSKEKLALLDRMAAEADKMLRVLTVILSSQTVPAGYIEALDQFAVRTGWLGAENTQLLLKCGTYAKKLHKELSSRQHIWGKEEGTSKICGQAIQVWQTIARDADQSRADLKKPENAEFEQMHRANMKERTVEQMALYRLPVLRTHKPLEIQGDCALTDAELERLDASLPPLPKYPPWRTRPAKLRANHAWVIAMMVVAIAGIGLSIARTALAGISFSAITQALFFASWLFIFPRFWKRR
jgi:hypothetical protein